MDEVSDDDLPTIGGIGGGFGDALLLRETRPESPARMSSSKAPSSSSKDIFGTPPATMALSQSEPVIDVGESPLFRRHAKRPLFIPDDDSESESVSPTKPTVSSSPVSPALLHPITTPTTHTRTSTPPTSEGDEDMPSVKHLNKGKGKAVQRDISPLRLKRPETKTSSTKYERKGKQTRHAKIKVQFTVNSLG
jgi:hypothetical protein